MYVVVIASFSFSDGRLAWLVQINAGRDQLDRGKSGTGRRDHH